MAFNLKENLFGYIFNFKLGINKLVYNEIKAKYLLNKLVNKWLYNIINVLSIKSQIKS